MQRFRASKFAFIILLLLLHATNVVFAVLPLTQPPDNSKLSTLEVWRVRIDNSECGRIEISLDQGQKWTLIGRVSTPATQSLKGYLAAGYAPVGTVAAEAVHGIRIRLGSDQNAYPNLINIVPREFASTPVFYGGHIAGASGIYTDIPTGVSLFRDFAPYVGSICYLTDPKTGNLTPLDTEYSPTQGDILTLIVKRRVIELRSIIFPNKAGEPVTATYADGSAQIITTVAKGVTGVGRFDGTSYTGVGAVNTNHTCVITISTAPRTSSTLLEGVGDERRGGFQIEPFYHNTQTDEVGSAQVMVVGHDHINIPELEGREPLYFGSINLAWNPDDLAHSWTCDVQTLTTGESWIPMPEMIGSDPEAIEHRGITAFRLHRDKGDDPIWLAQRLKTVSESYEKMRFDQSRSGDLPLVHGNYLITDPISPKDMKNGAPVIEFYVDGQYIGITNSPPFLLQWDSRSVPNGEYALKAQVQNQGGVTIGTSVKCIYVNN